MITARKAIDFVIGLEGGYVNDPNDPGGETKYGISKRAYPDVDIEALTVADAARIYERDYWNPVASVVPHGPLRVLVFDSAVNHGVTRALNWYGEGYEFGGYVSNRMHFYTSLSGWSRYGRGWSRRLAKVVDFALDGAYSGVAWVEDKRPWFYKLSTLFDALSKAAWRVRTVEGMGRVLELHKPR